MNLFQVLDDYQCGKRALPSYTELRELDRLIAQKDATIAALRAALLAIATEQNALVQPYFLTGAPHG